MTAVSRNNYTHLRNCMLTTSNQYINRDKIERLKHQFELEINSVRRLEKIATIEDLIELLEKRAHLSENDITALTEIAKTINNFDYLHEVQKLHRPQIIPVPPVMPAMTPITPLTHTVESREPNTDIRSKVHALITTELGKSWADFARGLNIREGKLDDLKCKYRNDMQGCIREVLQYHVEHSHPREWKATLLEALTHARRNDLRKAVENIYYNYS